VIILGKSQLLLKNRAQFRPGFIIVERIVERQSLRVNLIDRNVDVNVVRIVVDHAYTLVRSRAPCKNAPRLRSV
jgi:hypothetical protein